jgi:Flp pilus assembly protein TadD
MENKRFDQNDEGAVSIAKALLLVSVLIVALVAVGVLMSHRGEQAGGPSVESVPATERVDTSTQSMPTAPPVATGPVSLAECQAAWTAGHNPEAADLFGRYAADHPDNLHAQYMLGLASWKAGRNADAERALRAAQEIDPENVKVMTNLARVLIEENDSEQALAIVNHAIEVAPDQGELYRVAGRAYQNLSRSAEAIASYEKAVALDPDDAWALNNLGFAYIQSGRSDLALAPLARAAAIKGDVPVIQNNLGIALEQEGYYAEAAQAFTQAVALGGPNGKAAVSLRRVEGRADDPALAPLDLAALGQGFRVAAAAPADTTKTVLVPKAEPTAVKRGE